MQIPKEQVLEFVAGGSEEVARADELLPELVDSDRDAALLGSFGIDAPTLLGQFNGKATS